MSGKSENWLLDFMTCIGAGNIVDLYKNSPDKKPDDLDLDKAAEDFIEEKHNLYRQSDSYKKQFGDAGVIAAKKFRKALNEKLNLGFSNTEVEKMTNDEFSEKANEKIQGEYESRQNGKTVDLQKKLDDSISENNKLKTSIEALNKKYDTDIAEERGKFQKQQKAAAIDKLFGDEMKKRKFGDEAQTQNAEDVIRARMSKDSIRIEDGGKIYTGEEGENIFMPPGSKQTIKTIGEYIDYVSTERNLIQKSAGGSGSGGQRTTPPPGSEPKLDERAQQMHDATMSKLNKFGVLDRLES